MIFDETITNSAFNLGMPIEYFKGLCASPLSSYYLYRESIASISPIKKEINRRKQMKLDTEKKELEIALESLSDKELELMSENEDLKDKILKLENELKAMIRYNGTWEDSYGELKDRIEKHWLARFLNI